MYAITIYKITNGGCFAKDVGGLRVLVLCVLTDDALYLHEDMLKYFNSFKVTMLIGVSFKMYSKAYFR